MKTVLFALTLIIWQNSFSCFTAPAEYVVSDEVLTSRTNKIYWAEAISKNEKFEYEFKVLDDLKTSGQKSNILDKLLIFLHLKNYEPTTGEVTNVTVKGHNRPYKSGDFNQHKEESFFSGWQGRVDMEADCELYPTFEVGKRYLIFADKPYHHKSFEEVNSIDDNWYKKVRKLVSK